MKFRSKLRKCRQIVSRPYKTLVVKHCRRGGIVFISLNAFIGKIIVLGNNDPRFITQKYKGYGIMDSIKYVQVAPGASYLPGIVGKSDPEGFMFAYMANVAG